MGLDTTHDCWSGSYSAFNVWRAKICEVAGMGDIKQFAGYLGSKAWPNRAVEPLVSLLDHSDCEGEIHADECEAIASRLESLIPSLENVDRLLMSSYVKDTNRWITGLRCAAERGENVEFH